MLYNISLCIFLFQFLSAFFKTVNSDGRVNFDWNEIQRIQNEELGSYGNVLASSPLLDLDDIYYDNFGYNTYIFGSFEKAAYIYGLNSTKSNSWYQLAILFPDIEQNTAFACSVAIYGSIAAVGMYIFIYYLL
jgi:hypothetical protein